MKKDLGEKKLKMICPKIRRELGEKNDYATLPRIWRKYLENDLARRELGEKNHYATLPRIGRKDEKRSSKKAGNE